MPAAIVLKEGLSADEFRAAAAAAKDPDQARRLLSLAAIRDGMNRTQAARIGGMDRQTLRDWVHAYNERGIAGLINVHAGGPSPKLTWAQKVELGEIARIPPDPEIDGLVRWRRCDLAKKAKELFDVTVDPDTIGRMLHELGMSYISARPVHPKQDPGTIASFQKR
jgi:transposase